jgi:hypothetical protein
MNTSHDSGNRRRRAHTWDPWMVALLSLETGVFVWGTAVFLRSPAASYPHEMRDYYCNESGHLGETVAALWAPYTALVIVGVIALMVLAGSGTHRMRRRVAVVGLVLVVLTFPGCAAIGVGMDCGL